MIGLIDSVCLWLPKWDIPRTSTPHLNLSNAVERTSMESGEISNYGNIDNLRVSISANGISVKGSFAKYLLSDNYNNLNNKQIAQAIEKLSDALKTDVSSAKVTRIDAAHSFVMKHEVKRYFEVLGSYRYYDRVQTSINTLYYQSKGKKSYPIMLFYDKIQEMRDNKINVPYVDEDANVLRYERRWLSRLPQQFKEREITAKTLCNERFYLKIVEGWRKSYTGIEKKRVISFEGMDKIKTVSDGEVFIYAIALQELQQGKVQQIMDELKRRGVFTDPKSYSRLKSKVKNTSTKAEITETDALVSELDSHIKG